MNPIAIVAGVVLAIVCGGTGSLLARILFPTIRKRRETVSYDFSGPTKFKRSETLHIEGENFSMASDTAYIQGKVDNFVVLYEDDDRDTTILYYPFGKKPASGVAGFFVSMSDFKKVAVNTTKIEKSNFIQNNMKELLKNDSEDDKPMNPEV
jgi:hypothetical protein